MKRQLIFLLVCMILFSQMAYADDIEVRIALIDTGISRGVFDEMNIIEGINYIDPSADTTDLVGHGTAVAGIIVGSKSVNIKAIAPKAKLVPLVIGTKTADGKIVMGDADILAKAIRDAIDIYNCKIINISSGTLLNKEILKKAIDYAEEKGVIVISSVGNDNKFFPDNIYYPAAYDTVIGVSALKKNGEIASFSQRNSSVSICAPGDRLKLASIKPGKTTVGFGTSYATAYVSAAVSILVNKYPNLTPKDIREIIYKSANDLGEVGYDMDTGWGALSL